MKVLVYLTAVSLHSYQDETERVLLSESSSHHGLDLTEVTTEGPALSEGGVNSPGGDTQPGQQLGQGQRHQQHQGGHGQHPAVSQSVTAPSQRMILLGGGDHVETEHEDHVSDDDEDADHKENEALENFVPGDSIVEEILSVRLEQRMMTGAVLQPDGRRGKQSAATTLRISFLQENYCNFKQTHS